ncbi:MAG: hypothetical protein ACKOA8_04975 [Deltaproteobacteria bacterium]
MGAAFLSSASIWVLVVDGTRKLSDKELELFAKYSHIPHFVFWNKKDLPDWRPISKPEAFEVVEGSVFNASDLEQFWMVLESLCKTLRLEQTGPVPTAVQSGRLQAVNESLADLKADVAKGLPPEILAEKNRNIMVQLENVVGKVEVDDVLGRIFTEFCIGK